MLFALLQVLFHYLIKIIFSHDLRFFLSFLLLLGDLRETLVKFSEDINEIKSDLKPLSKGIGYLLQELLDPWEKIHSETKSQVEENEKENLKPVTA
jgi:hypothetical protein